MALLQYVRQDFRVLMVSIMVISASGKNPYLCDLSGLMD